MLITQHTLRQMAEKAKQFDIRPVDHVTVKGKEEPCKIYEVINGDAVRPPRNIPLTQSTTG